MKYFLIVLSFLATFGLFSGASEPVITPLRGTWIEPILHSLHVGNAILFNLCVAYLGSFFFWLLVVQYPEFKRRKLLRNNLSRQYKQFKESVIQVLLWASASGGMQTCLCSAKLLFYQFMCSAIDGSKSVIMTQSNFCNDKERSLIAVMPEKVRKCVDQVFIRKEGHSDPLD